MSGCCLARRGTDHGMAAQAGHLEALFQRYANDLRRFLRRHLRNAADIEDCTQEAFLAVWQQGARGGLREDIRGYLFTTALNIVRDKRRREVVRQQDFHVPLSDIDKPLRSSERETDHYWKEGLRLVEGELKNLRPSTRKVFLMHHVEQLTFTQIAVRLGVSTRTVEREIVRALDHMKTALGSVFKDIASDEHD